MNELKIAFWNVQNCFAPGVVPRGPKHKREFDSKIGRLTRVVGRMFAGAGPDVLALAEIGDYNVFDTLRQSLGAYEPVWIGANVPGQSGLGMLFRKGILDKPQIKEFELSSYAARPRSMIVECRLKGIQAPFLLVVNHWKSRLIDPMAKIMGDADRKNSAMWLGDYLALASTIPCVIVIGDFNAEPCDSVFGETQLRGKRAFNSALYSKTPNCLYNTAWRYLSEPDYWEDTGSHGYKESRPKTTHDSGACVVFDQLLVSGDALRGRPLKLLEKSVCYHCDSDTANYLAGGAIRPKRWCFAKGIGTGASDHFPLVASFEIAR